MRRPTVITFWAALLLVLAASPLTAPFSTCSVADLLANRDAQISGVLQAKPAKDDPAAVLLITAARPSSLFATDASRLHGGLAAVPRHALQIPLRL